MQLLGILAPPLGVSTTSLKQSCTRREPKMHVLVACQVLGKKKYIRGAEKLEK
jgi:hypothetical protein